jgi:hypothetical protein
VTRELAELPVDKWPGRALGYVRGMVDFVDRKADARAERCPLLPWWAEFAGAAERVRNLPEEDRRKKFEADGQTAVGKSEARIMRCARGLWAIRKAFGPEYLLERLLYYALPKITDEDRDFARELERYKYTGWAGLPTERPDEGIPF